MEYFFDKCHSFDFFGQKYSICLFLTFVGLQKYACIANETSELKFNYKISKNFQLCITFLFDWLKHVQYKIEEFHHVSKRFKQCKESFVASINIFISCTLISNFERSFRTNGLKSTTLTIIVAQTSSNRDARLMPINFIRAACSVLNLKERGTSLSSYLIFTRPFFTWWRNGERGKPPSNMCCCNARLSEYNVLKSKPHRAPPKHLCAQVGMHPKITTKAVAFYSTREEGRSVMERYGSTQTQRY